MFLYMNKVIVVGHPSCQIEDIKNILIAGGMQDALPSRREQLSAQQITQLICQAHNVKSIEHLRSVEEFSFTDVQPIWQGLALDLLLSNINIALWGWADPNILPLLRFWKNVDPSIIFVMVYNSPEYYLLNEINEHEINEDVVNEKLNNWYIYNKIALEFFIENSDRSMLVNYEEVRKSTSVYIKEAGNHIDNLLNVKLEDNVVNMMNVSVEKNKYKVDFLNSNPDDISELYFVNSVLNKNSNVVKLFNDMQSVSNLPKKDSVIDFDDYQCWLDIVNTKKRVFELEKTNSLTEHMLKEALSKNFSLTESSQKIEELLVDYRGKNDILMIKIGQLNEELDNYYLDKKNSNNILNDNVALKKIVSEIEKERNLFRSNAEWRSNKIKELSGENKQLEALISKLRDELEQKEVITKSLESLQSNLSKKLLDLEKEKNELKNKAEWRSNKIKELDTEKKQLDALTLRLKEELKEGGKDGINESNLFLEKKVKQMEEELQYYYVSNKKKNIDLKYGAAMVIRNDIYYQVGSRILEDSKSVSSLAKLPFTLYKQVQTFTELNYPKIDLQEYADADKAEELKKHLSYRLGKVFMENKQGLSSLVKLPFIMSKEVFLFKTGK